MATITAAFTAAYEGYFIPLKFTDPATATYLHVHDIVLEASPIWFKDDKPIAIGALGVRERRGWVGAFGIAPEYRGKGLAQAMFGELIRLAKRQKVTQITLEVLEENAPARAIYQRAGFKKMRRLFSLDSTSLPGSQNAAQRVDAGQFFGIEDNEEPPPCWQRERRSLERRASQLAAVQSGKSFAVYRANADEASIWKMSLGPEGDTVLAGVARSSGAQILSVSNEPEGSNALLQLYDRGWSPVAVQYEMCLTL